MRNFSVAEVGSGLVADADGVEGDHHGVHEDADDGQQGVEDEHHALHEQDEDGQDGDDDVELGHAGNHTAVSFELIMVGGGYTHNELHTTGTCMGW